MSVEYLEKIIAKDKAKRKIVADPFELWCAKEAFGFQGKAKNKVYLGVEMEFELTEDVPDAHEEHDDISDFYDRFNKQDPFVKRLDKINREIGEFALIKEDASLKHGIEIAAAPSGYRNHTGQWNKFFRNLKKHKLASESTCGMHVHVSKKRLTDRQQVNLVCFFHKDNKAFLEAIAGRKENKYCRYKLTGGEKREALNRTPKVTWEFRLFKAPTTREQFLTRLQFVQALLEYSNMKKFTYDYQSFKVWLNKQKGFKELRTFIEINEL